MISAHDSCTKEDWVMKNRIRCQKDAQAELTDDRFDRKEAERRRYSRVSYVVMRGKCRVTEWSEKEECR
jgi:hypothetical protein